MNRPRHNPDAAILAAWEIRQQNLAIIESRGRYFHAEDHSPAEAAAFDEADDLIAQSIPKTLPGTLAKLWLALGAIGHSDTERDARHRDIIRRAVLADVEAIEREFEHDQSLVFTAIKSITAQMGSPSDSPQGGSPDAPMIEALAEYRQHRAECYTYDHTKPPADWDERANHAAAEEALERVFGGSASTTEGVIARLQALIPAIDQDRWVDTMLTQQGFAALYEQRDDLNGDARQLAIAVQELLTIAGGRA